MNSELINLFIDKVGRKPNDRDMSTLAGLKTTMTEERIIELIIFWTETKEKGEKRNEYKDYDAVREKNGSKSGRSDRHACSGSGDPDAF